MSEQQQNGEKAMMAKILNIVLALLLAICLALVGYSLKATVDNSVAIGRLEVKVGHVDTKLDKLVDALSKERTK